MLVENEHSYEHIQATVAAASCVEQYRPIGMRAKISVHRCASILFKIDPSIIAGVMQLTVTPFIAGCFPKVLVSTIMSAFAAA